MSQGIALGTDEEVVKEYRIGRCTWRQGSIDVVVTNKRVIRYEDSSWFWMHTNRIDEINIDAVHGSTCTMARSISKIGLFFALVLIAIGIYLMVVAAELNGGLTAIGLIALLGAVVILACSFRPSMTFCLHGSIGGSALDTSVNVMGRMYGKNYASVIFQFKPTPQTTEMLKEIGAVFYDLKTLGDKAIEKWK